MQPIAISWHKVNRNDTEPLWGREGGKTGSGFDFFLPTSRLTGKSIPSFSFTVQIYNPPLSLS